MTERNVVCVACKPLARHDSRPRRSVRHVTEAMRNRARISPDPHADQLIAELETYLPPADLGPGYLGFAVPLRLRTDGGELRLITTLTSFATATDISLAELHLEAFLPADEATARYLRERALLTEQAGGAGGRVHQHDRNVFRTRPPATTNKPKAEAGR